MSIASALTALNTDIENARTAITNKGGTVTVDGGSSHLATDIATIPTGGGTTSKFGLTPDSIIGDVNSSNVLQDVTTDTNLVFDDVEDIATNVLRYRFTYNPKIKSVSFPDLTTISGGNALQQTFTYCTGLTSFSFPELVSITGATALGQTFYNNSSITSAAFPKLTTLNATSAMSSTFRGCSNLASVSLPELTTVTGQNAMNMTFYDCTSLTSVEFPKLTTLNSTGAMNSIFGRCTNLTSVTFPELVTIGANNSAANNAQLSQAFIDCNLLETLTFPKLESIYITGSNSNTVGTFYNNNKIKKMYFPKLATITYGSGAVATNQNACKLIFAGCSELTEIHFGAANETAIKATAGWSTLWGRGAGNATVYFDL